MGDTEVGFVGAVLFVLATLLPIINPPGVAPIFLSMTRGASDAMRATLAARIARNSCVLLLVAMVAGSYVLMFFGLSLAVIRIAGGLLVIATAWHLLSAEEPPDPAIVAAPPPASLDVASRSFYPLTFPVTIGPGSISVAVTLGAGVRLDAPRSPTAVFGSLAAIVVVSLTVYLCFRFASRLIRVLGGSGTVVLLRFSAFILLAVGIQILCDGLVERFTAQTSP